ncbi:MAG TPA: M48 family peptidase, partial [Candidatus Eisenbacteria bacterium]|nr:M48 family peptidase [Candidatus Eisenbacteria bacterium]
MIFHSFAALAALVLILARWAAQLWLERLNQRHVLAHAGAVPDAFKEVFNAATYAKSIQYTLAKSRLNQVESSYDLVILLIVLFSGVVPWG